MLAYSSIAHAGYIMVGVIAATYAPQNFIQMDAVIFYALAYTFGTIGAFGVLAWFGKRGEEATTYEDLSGLARKHPAVAFAMTIFMLSSAGIPPTAGFLAKFTIFKSAVQTGEHLLVVLSVVGVLASVCGVYYYLKVILSLYMKSPRREVAAIGGLEIKTGLIACVFGTLLFGIVPGAGLDLARGSVMSFLGAPPVVRVELNKAQQKVGAHALLGGPVVPVGAAADDPENCE